MVRAWIELDGEQAGWGPARAIVAKLGRDGAGETDSVTTTWSDLYPGVLRAPSTVTGRCGTGCYRPIYLATDR